MVQWGKLHNGTTTTKTLICACSKTKYKNTWIEHKFAIAYTFVKVQLGLNNDPDRLVYAVGHWDKENIIWTELEWDLNINFVVRHGLDCLTKKNCSFLKKNENMLFPISMK